MSFYLLSLSSSRISLKYLIHLSGIYGTDNYYLLRAVRLRLFYTTALYRYEQFGILLPWSNK